jgi:hypothetical protein
VDDGDAICVIDDADLQGLAVRRRSDEHRDVGIVGLEASSVVSQCMEDVVVGDTVRAGARLDVHPVRLRIGRRIVNICWLARSTDARSGSSSPAPRLTRSSTSPSPPGIEPGQRPEGCGERGCSASSQVEARGICHD